MTKKRKIHPLTGTIQHCFLGKVGNKGPHRQQPFYCLEIHSESLFTKSQKETLYVFPNLVTKEVWKTLEQRTFENKKYHFFCEKRTRGWRLKEMEEIK